MAGMLTTTRRPLVPAPNFTLGRDLIEDLEDLTSRFLGSRGDGWFVGDAIPSMDLTENDGAIEAKLDLPGVEAKQIEVRINGNLMSITANRKEEKEEKGKTFHRVERRVGTFSRSVTLPCAVAEDKVEARYHDGVLTVTLPKAEQAKTHMITVKS
jgi:HSP20 family protein